MIQPKVFLAELRSLHLLLHRDGPKAFRAALEAAFGGSTAVPPPASFREAVEILESLAGAEPADPEEVREAAAVLIAWLMAQRPDHVPPAQFKRIVQRLTALKAAEAAGARLKTFHGRSPVALLFLGFLEVARGGSLAGAALIEEALAAGLPERLTRVAEEERAGLHFRRLGQAARPGTPALALVEPLARPDLLLSLLEEAEELSVAGGISFALDNEPLLQEAFAAGRLKPVPFRIFPDRDCFDAADLFAGRLLRLASRRFPWLRFLADASEEDFYSFLSLLRLRFKTPMRGVFNALRALEISGAQRVFLISASGWLAYPLALRLTAENSREVQIACGAPSAARRRQLGKILASPEPLTALRALLGEVDRSAPEAVVMEQQPTGAPLIELSAPPTGQGRRCIICVTLRKNVGMSVEMPLRQLVARLLPAWEPLIVVLGSGGRGREEVFEALQGELGELLPRVRILWFSLLSAYGTDAEPPGLGLEVASLLGEAEVQRIEVEGLKPADLLMTPCQRFFAELASTAPTATPLEALLRAWSPEVVLTSQPRSADWSLLQMAARRLGIPTLGLQIFALNRDPWRPAIHVDHFLCFDSYSRETVEVTAHFPPERTSLVGAVRWDTLIAKARSFDRATERRHLEIGEGEKLVVLFTQPLDLEDNRALLDLTLEALRDLPAARLVVKLHPVESDDRLDAMQRQVLRTPLAQRTLVTRRHDTYRLLAAADLVVNVFSNVGIEAAILDLDVVAVEIAHDFEMFSLGTLGVVEPARSREAAIAQIRGLLTDPGQRAKARALRNAYFDRNPALRDGRALERVVAALEAAADEGRAGRWQGHYRLPSLDEGASPARDPAS